MYNRYVPAEGGGYVRQSMPEEPPLQEEPTFHIPCEEPPPNDPPPPKKGILSHLKNLLPQSLDTGDLLVLIVVLLLLLEKDEDNEDLLPVLITAAAFLFLK